MKKSIVTALLIGLSLAATAEDMVIANVTVVSPEHTAPKANQYVRIVDGRIAEMADKPLAIQATTLVIDGAGKFLTPGLIDSHVHLYHATGLKRRYSKNFASLYADYMAQMPRSYLYHGYTSVIELNADYETNRRVASSELTPELYHCGQGLVVSKDFMSTEFDSAEEFFSAFPNFLHDRYTTPTLPAGFDPADHTPAATVARIAKEDGRCVKLYYEEALWWPGERPDFALPSEAIVKEVVAEAHRRGMTVLLHGTTPNAQKFALATGVDVLAHGAWEWPGSRLDESTPSADLASLTDQLAQSALQLQPTMQTLRNELSLTTPDFLEQRALTKVLPAPYLDYLRSDAQVQKQELIRRTERIAPVLFPELDMQRFDLPKMQHQYISRYERLIGQFQQRGGKLLFGSDTSVGGLGWGNPPGLNGYWEMRAWHAAGIPLQTIFYAATLGNAKAFGLDAELGSVSVGKRANLLLLGANPLNSIDAWDQIDQVILQGRLLERQILAADTRQLAVADVAIEPAKGRDGFALRVWYPTLDKPDHVLGASRIRDGYRAARNGHYAPAVTASGKTEKAPLIVLSHGSGGSADAMAWIAEHLVRKGAIVVAANHPASTGGNAERASILELWQQPLDVSQLLDQLLDKTKQPEWSARIDASRISHIGFSLGGSTALMLAGAQFELQSFGPFCQTQTVSGMMDGACRAFSHYLPQFDSGHYERSNGHYRDPRIKAVISIAPGFTETLTDVTVKKMKTPVLLLAAANDQQLPPATHIAPVRHLLPKNLHYVEIADAHHFSLLPQCKPGAVAVLAESKEEFVCQETGHKTREQIHAEALAHMDAFLKQQRVIR